MLTQGMSGHVAVNAYLQQILGDGGLAQSAGSFAIGIDALRVVATVVAGFTVEKFGRKKLFVGGGLVQVWPVAYLRGGARCDAAPFGPTMTIFYRRLFMKRCVFCHFPARIANNVWLSFFIPIQYAIKIAMWDCIWYDAGVAERFWKLVAYVTTLKYASTNDQWTHWSVRQKLNRVSSVQFSYVALYAPYKWKAQDLVVWLL